MSDIFGRVIVAIGVTLAILAPIYGLAILAHMFA